VIDRIAAALGRWARPLTGTVVVELVAVLGTLGASHQAQAAHIDAVGAALIAAAAAMVAVARRWPSAAFGVALATTVAYVVLGYPTDSPHFLGLLVTAYLVPQVGHRGRTGVFVVLTLASFAATDPFTGNPASWAWPALALITAIALLAGQATAELNARAEARATRLREEETRQRLATERLAIARDLHDVVSHSIAMVNVQAGVALHVIDERPEQAREALVAIKAASHDALTDLRAILGLLRDGSEPEAREPAPGLAQLPDLVAAVGRAGVTVALDDGLSAPLPQALDLTAYRVVQEALTNVVRHAPGASTHVRIERDGSAVRVEVENDRPPQGRAPEPAAGAGLGLAGMRERVVAVGGELESGARPDGGFRVVAHLPLPDPT
jgi:signal transduction histidine kinase